MKALFVVFFLSLVSFSFPVSADHFITQVKKVNSGIYRGGRIAKLQDAKYLQSLSIKNIINLQGGDLNSRYDEIVPWFSPGEQPELIAQEKELVLSLGLGFFHAPLSSLMPITKEEDLLINQILAYMHDENNQPVYIHCEHGEDRTGLIIALYRVKYEGLTPTAAREEWINSGHNRLHQLVTKDLDHYYFLKIKEFF